MTRHHRRGSRHLSSLAPGGRLPGLVGEPCPIPLVDRHRVDGDRGDNDDPGLAGVLNPSCITIKVPSIVPSPSPRPSQSPSSSSISSFRLTSSPSSSPSPSPSSPSPWSPPTPTLSQSSSTSPSPSTSSSPSTSATSTTTSLSTESSSPLTFQTHFTSQDASSSTIKSSGQSITFSPDAMSSTALSPNSAGSVPIHTIVGAMAAGLFGVFALFVIGSWISRRWNRRILEPVPNGGYNTPRSASPINRPDSLDGGDDSDGQDIVASGVLSISGPGTNHEGYAGYPDEDGSFAGAYSSQPQVQVPYNPEAYGQDVPSDSGAGYREATRAFQGQRGSEALPANTVSAVSDPAPHRVTPILAGSVQRRNSAPQS